MLDMEWIRANALEAGTMVQRRGGSKASVEQLLKWDETKRVLQTEAERLRYERNQLSGKIAGLIKNGSNCVQGYREQAQAVQQQLAEAERQLADATQQWQQLVRHMPNRISPDTPDGNGEDDNVEIHQWGEVPQFAFAAKDHVELGESLGMFDLRRGVKMAGMRNYVLRGTGALLQAAVQRLAVDALMERGFELMEVPLLVRGETLYHAGFFPEGEEQTYRIEAEDKYLIGTSEASLVSCFSGEVIDVRTPLKVTAATPCFRKEVGSAGKDVRGLYRVHQFAKVEQVVLCRADDDLAEQLLRQLTHNAEHILQQLELPYRVVAVCAGDMSPKAYKQFDIETWMPSRGAYGETHSSSSLLDYQTRRANIRYKDDEGKLRYGYTLNNTAIAAPRILIPLLENHQREDGTVYIPQALRKYMSGMACLQTQTP